MPRLTRVLLATLITACLGACASQPPLDSLPTPPKRQLDAKTQLETGRKY